MFDDGARRRRLALQTSSSSCLLFTFFGNMVTWSIGANQTISATGLDETAPGVFGHVNKRFGTPDYAFVLMGVIATAITILAYVLDPNQTSVFWTLFALSSIVFLIPYLLMFPALLVLRRKHPGPAAPVRDPGRHGRRLDLHDPLRGRHRRSPSSSSSTSRRRACRRARSGSSPAVARSSRSS